MFRRLLALLVMVIALASCATAPTPTPPPDPSALVRQAVANLRQADTFRILVERTGAAYLFETAVGQIIFRRATAQYVAPDVIEATMRVLVAGVPTDVSLFARGERQWFENDILTGGEWADNTLSPGFDPRFLVESDSGFQAAVNALRGLAYLGVTTLENGVDVYHLSATANGPEITGLLADLIYLSGEVTLDLFIDRARLVPARFVLTTPPDSAAEAEPMTLTVDLYDVGAEPELNDPEETQQP